MTRNEIISRLIEIIADTCPEEELDLSNVDPEVPLRDQLGLDSVAFLEIVMELRMRSGLPRANAVKYVHEKFGVNMLACVCAIDRAALPPLMEYWVPEVDVTGVTELVANALIMPGQGERTTDLRGEEIPGLESEDVETEGNNGGE